MTRSAAAQPDAYQRVAHRFGLAMKVEAAGSVLSWDSQTHMPIGGAWARGEQMAALTEVGAELTGSPATADELAEAEAMAGALEEGERANLAEMRRMHVHAAAAPKELQAQQARLAQTLQAIWPKARADSDFAAFAGPFAELLTVVRESAAAKAEALGVSPYSALIDANDPGVSEATIDPIFDEMARVLPGLIGEVREHQAAWPAPIPFPAVTVERQEALSYALAAAVGHDRDHFRIDAAPHPFSVPHAPGDVRFTTRYDVENPKFAVWATLHEAGHAMYEFNLPRNLAYQPTGLARGATFHESQSLSVERMAGRSAEFLSFLSPLMAEHFGGDPAPWAPDNVLNVVRRVGDGFIRVEADELSYPLHVILRYRLEQALLKGDLAVTDIPAAWNGMFERLLGRLPPNDGLGCLQDIHWAIGLIGYFPNYAMGATLAAQLFEQAVADDPQILPGLGRGDFAPYFAWVKPRVHARASLTDFNTLVRDATGRPLEVAPLLRHLRRRYLEEPAPGN